MATSLSVTVSEDEYLCMEREAVEKSEYYAGKIVAMSGGSGNHASLANRIGALLDRQAPEDCTLYNSDMRIHIPASRAFTYPDFSLVCGEPLYATERQDVLLNPTLVVEVLSPSSAAYDRGKKFQIYQNIPTLREYLIVHQDRRCVEQYSRQPDGSWLISEHSGKGSCVTIDSPKFQIAISELYARTTIGE